MRCVTDDLRERLRAEAAERRIQAERLLQEADRLDELAASLHEPSRMGTLNLTQMQLEQITSRGFAISKGRLSSKKNKNPKPLIPFRKHLQNSGLSLPEWAAKHAKQGLNTETAKNWTKRPGRGGRPIPRLWADRLAAEFGDPKLAKPESWPNGIRD